MFPITPTSSSSSSRSGASSSSESHGSRRRSSTGSRRSSVASLSDEFLSPLSSNRLKKKSSNNKMGFKTCCECKRQVELRGFAKPQRCKSLQEDATCRTCVWKQQLQHPTTRSSAASTTTATLAPASHLL